MLCHPAQSDSQHRSIILKQLVSRPVFNEQDPLQQSVERMLGGSPVNLLLVVDDAHLLSPVLIAELWALVQQAQAEPGWQVNVLLFSQSGRLDKYLSQVSHGQAQAPLELEITDFTEQEVQTFVEVLFASEQLDANGRRALKEKALAAASRPGTLVQLDNTEQTNMARPSSRKLSPIALLVVLLTVVAAGLVFWFFPPADEPQQGMSSQPVPEMPDGPVLATGSYDESIEQQEAARAETVTEDSHRLPPEVSLEGLTVGRSDSKQRIVVPSDVVDAILSEQALGGSGEQAVTESLPDAEMVAPVKPAAEAAEPGARQEVKPVADITADAAPDEANEPPPLEAPPTVMGVELQAINARHYALQLAALTSVSAASNFIADYEIADIATVYETRRSGEPWFIIVTGDYPDIVTARRAETRLPARLRAVQPWVKSYAQIHREIERAK